MWTVVLGQFGRPAGWKARDTADRNVCATRRGRLPDSAEITSGTWRPTDYGSGGVLPLPAPGRPYGTNLAVFNGLDPNGVWRLFVADDTDGDSGSIANGWVLQLTVTAPIGPLLLPRRVVAGNIQLQFATAAGQTNVIQYKNFLKDKAWQILQTVVGDGSIMTCRMPRRCADQPWLGHLTRLGIGSGPSGEYAFEFCSLRRTRFGICAFVGRGACTCQFPLHLLRLPEISFVFGAGDIAIRVRIHSIEDAVDGRGVPFGLKWPLAHPRQRSARLTREGLRFAVGTPVLQTSRSSCREIGRRILATSDCRYHLRLLSIMGPSSRENVTDHCRRSQPRPQGNIG